MSARALQRIMVRMLFDASYAARVVATPADALVGEDLTEEERSWLASSDPRAWRADSGRPSRALTVLAQEYPTSLALYMAAGGPPGQPIGFFSSLEFHLCVRGRGSMAIAFGDYLIALSLKGALSDRRLTHLVRLEQAIARLRRGAPAVAPATGGPGSLLQRSPDKALHEAAEGTADLHDEIYADLPASGAELAAAVLAPGRAVPCTQVDPEQDEPLLLELVRDDGPRVRFPVGIAEVTRELFALLSFASTPRRFEDLCEEAIRLGAAPDDAAEVITSLMEEGALVGLGPSGEV